MAWGIEMVHGELFHEALVASASAIFKIMILVALGVWATYQGVFTSTGISDLGRLVYYVTLPSLVFYNILTEVTLDRLVVLWKLPFMAVLHIASANMLARLLNYIFSIKSMEANAVTLSLMFGNVGALTIAVIQTLCEDEPLKSDVGPSCTGSGIEQIALYLLIQNLLMFTWGEEVVRAQSYVAVKEEEVLEDGPAVTSSIKATTSSHRIASPARDELSTSAPLVSTTSRRHSSSYSSINQQGQDEGPGPSPGFRLTRRSSVDRLTLESIASRYAITQKYNHPSTLAVDSIDRSQHSDFGSVHAADSEVIEGNGTNLEVHWMLALGRVSGNPTIRAAALAFLLGLIPPVKALFVGPHKPGTFGPPLGSVAAAVQILGMAQVPISMLMLSGSGTIRYLQSLEGEGSGFSFSSKASFCIIAGRVLLMPVVGVLWWKLLYAGGMRNPTETDLVVLIDSAVPTAQNIVMLVLVHSQTPEHGHALAYLILWQYTVAIPVLILNVAIFLTLVKQAHA